MKPQTENEIKILHNLFSKKKKMLRTTTIRTDKFHRPQLSRNGPENISQPASERTRPG